MTEFSSRFRFPSPPETATVKSTWESIKALTKGRDEVNVGEKDYLQAGVVEASDWSFTSEVTGAGAVQSAAPTGGKAWVPDPVLGTSVLMRSNVALGSGVVHGLTPSPLPGSGKYLTVGLELTGSTWNGAPVVSLVSGAEKATEAEAIAVPPAVTSGKIRIKNITIKNTAGTYSQVHEAEARQWATGGEAAAGSVAEGKIASEAVVTGKIKALAVTTAKIAAEAVTDAKVAAGRALLGTENGYHAQAAYGFNEPHTCSSTRMSFLSVSVAFAERRAEIIECKLFIGGVETNHVFMAGESAQRRTSRCAHSFRLGRPGKCRAETAAARWCGNR